MLFVSQASLGVPEIKGETKPAMIVQTYNLSTQVQEQPQLHSKTLSKQITTNNKKEELSHVGPGHQVQAITVLR